jgi:hypothetical protein
MATALNVVGSSRGQINFDTVPYGHWPAIRYNAGAGVAKVGKIQAEFERFHEQNPKVYEKLVEYAFAAKANGHKRTSIKLLFERLRWYHHVEVQSSAPWKFNNNWTASYARLIMQQEPALKDFFVTRERHT